MGYTTILNMLLIIGLALEVPIGLVVYRIGTGTVQVFVTVEMIDLEMQLSALAKQTLVGRVAMQKWGMMVFTIVSVPNLVRVVEMIAKIDGGVGRFGDYSLIIGVLGLVIAQGYFVYSCSKMTALTVKKRKKDVEDKKLEVDLKIAEKIASSISAVMKVCWVLGFVVLLLTIVSLASPVDTLPFTLPIATIEACLIANVFSGVKILSLKKKKINKGPEMLVSPKKTKMDEKDLKQLDVNKKKTMFGRLQVPLIGGFEAEKSYFQGSSTSQLNASYFNSQGPDNKATGSGQRSNPLPTIIITDRLVTSGDTGLTKGSPRSPVSPTSKFSLASPLSKESSR